MTVIKGGYSARTQRFGVVVSDFNEFFTRRLLEGALDTLFRHGAFRKNVIVVHVPGAFEMPLAAAKLIKKYKVDAVITLAVVIQGQTKHFDQVTRETAKGIREVSQRCGVPVILGMIPAKNELQAQQRVGIKQANKGRDWAMAAMEMASLMRKLKTQ